MGLRDFFKGVRKKDEGQNRLATGECAPNDDIIDDNNIEHPAVGVTTYNSDYQ